MKASINTNCDDWEKTSNKIIAIKVKRILLMYFVVVVVVNKTKNAISHFYGWLEILKLPYKSTDSSSRAPPSSIKLTF